MIDDIYKNVQAELNKDQLGYLKPMYFNTFMRQAQRKVYNDIFTELKVSVRKKNWHLDGKNFANYSELLRQLIEYYSFEEKLLPPFKIPENLEFIADIFYNGKRVSKIPYSTFQDLEGSLYAKPSNCAPSGSLVGEKIKVSPSDIEELDLHYIRKPKIPKWTFTEDEGKPFFDPTISDFQNIDMPTRFYDDLVSIVTEKSAIMLREQLPVQAENAEQSQESQNDNIQ